MPHLLGLDGGFSNKLCDAGGVIVLPETAGERLILETAAAAVRVRSARNAALSVMLGLMGAASTALRAAIAVPDGAP
ncbi:MAG: hypothetical protein MI924_07100 [Chloroflexales bacterium]|nr:hypothetical protein [Chloroflexales bacterium]